MYVIEIIPLTRGAHVDSLTYYAAHTYDTGTIVTIPLRKKEVRGMVLACTPVSAAKTAVRAATFSLRKLPEQPNATPLPHTLVATAQRIAETTPTTVGAALYALLPKEVRDGKQTLTGYETNTEPASASISVLQGLVDERYRIYRSTIREAFAHRGSVLFVVPTSADVERAHEQLSQGIERRIVTFSPIHGTKKRERTYREFDDISHAKLIITTPSHAFLDRHDITHIIIEQARSPFYKSRVRPYLDTRESLKILAGVTGRTVLLGDVLPRTEDEYYRREEIYSTENEHPRRLTFPSKIQICQHTEEPTAEAPFQLFTSKLHKEIEETTSARKNMFLLAARRGLAPVVACADCGYIFRCPDSGAPYSLFTTTKGGEEQRWFLSTTSGKRVRAADTCTQCGSWRLRERGIGIQYIQKDLQRRFPDVPVVLFDHTTATTYRNALKLLDTFYYTKGAILLGTPMVLPHLGKPVHQSAIVSLDATRAMPTWRADEELLSLILTLRERTIDTVFIQTRQSASTADESETNSDSLLEYATRGYVDQFYTDEIALRQALKYPPFSVFILLTFEGTKDAVTYTEAQIQELLAPTKLTCYNAPQSTAAKTVRNALIRIPTSEWPKPELIEKLKTLPPSVRIEVDPHRIV